MFSAGFHKFITSLFLIIVLAIGSVGLVLPNGGYAYAKTGDDTSSTTVKKKSTKKPVKKTTKSTSKTKKKTTKKTTMQSNPDANIKGDSSKYASLVIDADSGVILHQENAGELRYPASLVKMMTLYMAFQAVESGKLSMSQRLPVSAHAASQAPSSMFLNPGETISLNDAIMALVIKSANDCAVVVAEGVGGSEENFAEMMNRMAKKLGMNHTTFKNATGLPNLQQKTTAFDLARLAVALRRDYPQYYGMFERTEFTYKGKVYYTHNRVTKNYPGADGLKTGYIRASGFNLVTSAKRGGTSLVGVVMGGQSIMGRDRNMMKLLDGAFYKVSKEGSSDAVSMDVNSSEDEAAPGAKVNVNYAPEAPVSLPEIGTQSKADSNQYSKLDNKNSTK